MTPPEPRSVVFDGHITTQDGRSERTVTTYLMLDPRDPFALVFEFVCSEDESVEWRISRELINTAVTDSPISPIGDGDVRVSVCRIKGHALLTLELDSPTGQSRIHFALKPIQQFLRDIDVLAPLPHDLSATPQFDADLRQLLDQN